MTVPGGAGRGLGNTSRPAGRRLNPGEGALVRSRDAARGKESFIRLWKSRAAWKLARAPTGRCAAKTQARPPAPSPRCGKERWEPRPLHPPVFGLPLDKSLCAAGNLHPVQRNWASAGTWTISSLRSSLRAAAATLARGIAAAGRSAHGECDMRLRVLVSGLTFFATAMLAAVAPFVANA